MIRFSEFHFEVEFLKVPAITLWKINIEPKHGGLEDDFPFQLGGCGLLGVYFLESRCYPWGTKKTLVAGTNRAGFIITWYFQGPFQCEQQDWLECFIGRVRLEGSMGLVTTPCLGTQWGWLISLHEWIA